MSGVMAQKWRRVVLLPSLALVFWSLGNAVSADEPDMHARQLVALFGQACVAQYGDIAAVRVWLEERHVPHNLAQNSQAFLQGEKGVVYNASNATGLYGITTRDDGVCHAFAFEAKAKDVIPLLETSLKDMGLTVILLKDHTDDRDSRAHHYDYLVVRNGVNFNLVATVSEAPAQLQAQLGFWRRGPGEPLPSPLPAPR